MTKEEIIVLLERANDVIADLVSESEQYNRMGIQDDIETAIAKLKQ